MEYTCDILYYLYLYTVFLKTLLSTLPQFHYNVVSACISQYIYKTQIWTKFKLRTHKGFVE